MRRSRKYLFRFLFVLQKGSGGEAELKLREGAKPPKVSDRGSTEAGEAAGSHPCEAAASRINILPIIIYPSKPYFHSAFDGLYLYWVLYVPFIYRYAFSAFASKPFSYPRSALGQVARAPISVRGSTFFKCRRSFVFICKIPVYIADTVLIQQIEPLLGL